MKIDERDTILSRIRYQPNDGMYEDYYKKHPEKQAIDDLLRAMPDINAETTPMYQSLKSPFADSAFDFIADIKQFSRQNAKRAPQHVDAMQMTTQIKKLAHYLGASAVGIAKMDADDYYTHRGRTKAHYGTPITDEGAYGIVLIKEMNREMINRAPHLEEMTEVTKAYFDLAVMGMWLSYYIANLGYDAKNNMDMDYLMYTPRVAELAGLGEVGRAGLLVTPDYGMRVRIGIVTTDLPLVADKPIDYGIKGLCGICGLCAKHCPSRAIMRGKPVALDENRTGYISDQEKCFKMWKTLGTDCGICLSVCPLSQALPDDVRQSLQTDPKSIVDWHRQKIGKRVYTKEPLALFRDE
ncbi:4Fe-4S ferredoxin [Fusibacter paucivorans]|uniref:4Fe-4S ferredoxin n=1 Tax=Fusibacter paucivorans TaxID=76009 RepID=A0ABS5PLT7_9FIRM|nr:reductive dehalogenase domain-containing protein [Fusibacter paucivorans]MBS7526140.1 4Fe-4S ferredoxin [Fusibacter paucivorans]